MVRGNVGEKSEIEASAIDITGRAEAAVNLVSIGMDNQDFLSNDKQQLITPLMVGSYLGQANNVTKLLQSKANVNKRCLNSGNSALFFAILGKAEEKDKLALVKQLIDHGAYVTFANREGHNILYYCIENNFLKLAEYLLQELSKEIGQDLLVQIIENEPIDMLEYCTEKEERKPLLDLSLKAIPLAYMKEQIKEENILPTMLELKLKNEKLRSSVANPVPPETPLYFPSQSLVI